ncbi:MAG: HsdM family class I SAM-dependent methyltransferase [Ginsengibacter sp.]
MLTSNLKKDVEKKWDNCWPVSTLRPVAILDLISYIFFVKKLDDHDLIAKNLSSMKSGHFVFTKEIEEFSWTTMKDMHASAIHDLFTRQYGIIDLLTEYSHSGFLYSPYFKRPLLLKPTAKLLLNVIQLVNLIESSDTATQSAIIEYLFGKAEKAGEETQFIPQFISRLMISIAEPRTDDIICDFSTGNGSLLINAAEYLQNNHPHFKNDLSTMLKGLEPNGCLLRISAMRMMLHGIKNPDVQVLTSTDVSLTKKTTLFISSLLPPAKEVYSITDDITATSGNMEMILLNNILKNLQPGSRAIILVPESLLKNALPEIQNIRKDIVDNTNLEGVIHLFPNSKSYSAAGILIFNKRPSETTGKVWFCKMEKPKKSRTINETIKNEDLDNVHLSEDLKEANVILNNWKNRAQASNENSFFISVNDIRTNNYNLNFNDYKLISTSPSVDNPVLKNEHVNGNKIIATKKETIHHFYKTPAPLKKRRRKRKAFPGIFLLILVIILGFSYLNYFKANNNQNTQDVTNDSVKTLLQMQSQNSIRAKTNPSENKKSISAKEILNKNESATIHKSSQRYTVVNKAWFHSEPDSGKRKAFYLQGGQGQVVVPTREENGFVYIVYVNKKGQSTHGWLAKKDLEPVN